MTKDEIDKEDKAKLIANLKQAIKADYSREQKKIEAGHCSYCQGRECIMTYVPDPERGEYPLGLTLMNYCPMCGRKLKEGIDNVKAN